MQPNPDPAPQVLREDPTRKDEAENRVLPGRSAVRGLWKRIQKLTLFLVSVLLFVPAIELLKGGARGVAPLIGSHLDVDSLPNALGFGWLFAYLVMNGHAHSAVY